MKAVLLSCIFLIGCCESSSFIPLGNSKILLNEASSQYFPWDPNSVSERTGEIFSEEGLIIARALIIENNKALTVAHAIKAKNDSYYLLFQGKEYRLLVEKNNPFEKDDLIFLKISPSIHEVLAPISVLPASVDLQGLELYWVQNSNGHTSLRKAVYKEKSTIYEEEILFFRGHTMPGDSGSLLFSIFQGKEYVVSLICLREKNASIFVGIPPATLKRALDKEASQEEKK